MTTDIHDPNVADLDALEETLWNIDTIADLLRLAHAAAMNSDMLDPPVFSSAIDYIADRLIDYQGEAMEAKARLSARLTGIAMRNGYRALLAEERSDTDGVG